MKSYADVALPVAVDKTFTYSIPPELQSSAAIGCRVLVPFGRKYSTGLIVALPTTPPPVSLKYVRDIIDAVPIVPPELLQLCRWIADYYFAPIGEVLKAAIPHGLSSASKRLVRLTPAGSIADDTGKELRAPKRSALLRILREQGPAFSTDLQKKTGVKSINALLNELADAGMVELEEILPAAIVRPKTKEFILIRQEDAERIDETLRELSPRKKRVRRLLESLKAMIERGEDEITSADLLKRSGSSPSALRELKAAGIVSSERRFVGTQDEYGTEEQTLAIRLNAAQQNALARITNGLDAGVHRTILLHGVTGSGKTQVYIEAIRHCLALQKTAIVLVPEISLTPQIVRRFKTHFGAHVAVIHSRMSAGERHEVWLRASKGAYRVVIGPRSAVFAPLANIGLLVVDEEHESSYKQYDASPRYHARDCAIVRASRSNAVVVLGSATPSVESYFNARGGKYELVELPERVDAIPMPAIRIVDLTAERRSEYARMKAALPEDQRERLKDFKQPSISSLLKEKIRERLDRREGIILLQNRRGFAPFVECVDCGYAELCDNCSITLTYHLAKKHLRCHYCGAVRPPKTQCPTCGGPHLHLHGIGTQRVEQELGELFPAARVLRMDLDSTSRKGAHDRILREFGNGNADILLGTQMVAKGLDFPRVTLVGVISADTQMLLPDFRSSERTFQLLTQVSGRAGRSTLRGEVIIQTHQPEHFTLRHVIDHDFRAFYEEELCARQELSYPPFSRLALIETRGDDETKVSRAAEQFARELHALGGSYTVLGPTPAVIGKIRNEFRWHIIIKSDKTADPAGSQLRTAIRRVLTTRTSSRHSSLSRIVDLDPVSLL